MFKNSNNKMPNFLELKAEALSEFSTTNSDHNHNQMMTKSLTFSNGNAEQAPIELTNSLVVPQVQSRKVSLGGFSGFKASKKNPLDRRMTESAVINSKEGFCAKTVTDNGKRGFRNIFQNSLFGAKNGGSMNNPSINVLGVTPSKQGLISELNYQFLDAQEGFFDDLKAVGKLDEIKKYINIGEENELLERELDQSYLDNLLKKYEPIIKSSKDNSEQEAINTLTQSILGLTGSPMPNCMSMTSLVNKMHKKATAIMTRKIKGKDPIYSSDDEKKIGMLPVSEYRKKKYRWRMKMMKSRSRSKSNTRYKIREKLAKQRDRKHGRFIKSSKMRVTEILKQINSEKASIEGSIYSGASSRKSSINGLIRDVNKLNLNADDDLSVLSQQSGKVFKEDQREEGGMKIE